MGRRSQERMTGMTLEKRIKSAKMDKVKSKLRLDKMNNLNTKVLKHPRGLFRRAINLTPEMIEKLKKKKPKVI